MVVLSAGAFGSPQVLERSGVGAKGVLEKHGIEQIVDLPGVGENYQDHNVAFVPYYANDSVDTLDGLFTGSDEFKAKQDQMWNEEGKGLLAYNGIDSGIKLRPDEEDLKELGPEFKSTWESYFVDAPDKPVIWLGPIAGFVGDRPIAPVQKYLSVGYFTEYPVSLGRVHISSSDPHALPEFDAGYLQDPADVATLRWGYKKSREFARRMGAYRGEFKARHPSFSEDSAVACREDVSGPVDIDSPDLNYSTEDNEAIDNFHKQNVQTAWHSLGTCSMKPREQGGVVDSHLNVYGVEGLKIADMSIAPGNVGANTYSTALTIGEKAAVIIASELEISGV
jgi:alcohol oxidase